MATLEQERLARNTAGDVVGHLAPAQNDSVSPYGLHAWPMGTLQRSLEAMLNTW